VQDDRPEGAKFSAAGAKPARTPRQRQVHHRGAGGLVHARGGLALTRAGPGTTTCRRSWRPTGRGPEDLFDKSAVSGSASWPLAPPLVLQPLVLQPWALQP